MKRKTLNNRKEAKFSPKKAHMMNSRGPEGTISGTISQLCNQYAVLAKNAECSDPVYAERLYQYAEHYFRLNIQRAQ